LLVLRHVASSASLGHHFYRDTNLENEELTSLLIFVQQQTLHRLQSFSEIIYFSAHTTQKLPWGDQSRPWHSATGLHYLCGGSGDQLPEIKAGRNKGEGSKKRNITAARNGMKVH